jgi:[calcium/calmodulin-dependent protein kinase] kinase
MSGFPLEPQDMEGAVPVKLDPSGSRTSVGGSKLPASSRRGSRCHDDDDDDSDSDEGLTMARPKKKPAEAVSASAAATGAAAGGTPLKDAQAQTHGVERLIGSARRRDTNASVGSTETAKKMFVDSD